MKNKTKLIIIAIFSLIAFLSSFYLAYDWFFPKEVVVNPYIQVGQIVEQPSKICDINTLFSCTKVWNSEYSKLFWIPFSLYAMFMFSIVFIWSIIGLFKNPDYMIKLITIPSWAWVITNFYLFYLEIFVIKAFCPVCIGISVLLFSIFFISLFHSLKCTTKQ